jgi:uncharacterized membrane protein
MKNYCFIFILSIALLILLPITNSQEYYADIALNVQNTGEVSISGNTSHPSLMQKTTEEFTSKKGAEWELTISLPDTFSEYIYQINFPKGTQLLDINTNSEYRLSTNENKITLTGIGQEKKLAIQVKYKIIPDTIAPIGIETYIAALFLTAIIISGAYYFFMKRKGPHRTEKKTKYNKDALTERQLQIINYLEKNNGKSTQAEIGKITNLPKASLSRNIDSLERKGIVQKERKGMTQLVSIKED